MDILFKKNDISSDVALIIGVYEDLSLTKTAKKVDQLLKGGLTNVLKNNEFTGKIGQKQDLIPPASLQTKRLVCLGLGKKKEINELTACKIGAYAANALLTSGETAVEFAVDDLPAAAVGFGAKIASYRFTKHKTVFKKPVTLKEFYILTEKPQVAQNQYEPYFAISKGIHTARDLVNEPLNIVNPIAFAKRAEELQKYGLTTEVYDEKQLKAKGLNMMLGVAQGSVNPPRLVVAQWRGKPEDRKTHAVLVGKGVTFDSGGLSLKPSAGMEDMKEDLAGAATALGTLQALAMQRAKVNVAAVMAMVENMPSGTAQRPGDIVKSLSGTTVEVINTDAEGRLVLGDALWYAQERFKSPIIIDLASLTGAIIVALGTDVAGLFSNDDKLAGQMEKAAADSGEKVWRMPLDDLFEDDIVSDIADIKNATSTRAAGSITAAMFLKHFILPETKWAHLDIAGVALRGKDALLGPKGGSGFGVWLLDRYILDNLEVKN
ncbi:MAG: leucyl aminopeptidase [Alphaproteobacteria bacterium]|nr:leucyl aminopeptidase [Alphaproteobacteria bacterium]